MKCGKLIIEREELFKNILDIVPSFSSMSDEDQFVFLLTSQDLDISKVIISGVNRMYTVNQEYKQNI